MQEVQERLDRLQSELAQALKKIKYEALLEQKQELDKRATKSGLWKDNVNAQSVLKQQAQLTKRLEPWQKLKDDLSDIDELVKLDDESIRKDLINQIESAQTKLGNLRSELKFSGSYDSHNAIVSLYAGAGGTDAQDWTQMLFRMYSRWADKNNYKMKVIEDSSGEEAGLKSATFEISGPFAYGKLKGEHGVHRLVRLSPFNSAGSRETSFAKVDVLPEVEEPGELELDDNDLRVDVYRSGGHGGQSVNTTDSAVRITHIPTGISVAIQNERSQLQNKETVMTVLRSRLAQLQMEQHKEKLVELKGPNQSAEWGNQIRSYVLHPYKQVKDLRTKYESSDPEAVLNGDLDGLINAYLEE